MQEWVSCTYCTGFSFGSNNLGHSDLGVSPCPTPSWARLGSLRVRSCTGATSCATWRRKSTACRAQKSARKLKCESTKEFEALSLCQLADLFKGLFFIKVTNACRCKDKNNEFVALGPGLLLNGDMSLLPEPPNTSFQLFGGPPFFTSRNRQRRCPDFSFPFPAGCKVARVPTPSEPDWRFLLDRARKGYEYIWVILTWWTPFGLVFKGKPRKNQTILGYLYVEKHIYIYIYVLIFKPGEPLAIFRE